MHQCRESAGYPESAHLLRASARRLPLASGVQGRTKSLGPQRGIQPENPPRSGRTPCMCCLHALNGSMYRKASSHDRNAGRVCSKTRAPLQRLLAPRRRLSVAASTVVWHHQDGDEAHTTCRMRCISAQKARGIPRMRICCVPPPAARCSPAAYGAGQGASARSVASSRTIRLAWTHTLHVLHACSKW